MCDVNDASELIEKLLERRRLCVAARLACAVAMTLGTALGDWTADTAGLGYVGAAIIFSALLALVAGAYFWTAISRTSLFWTAFILTRPLGAVVGDFLQDVD